MASIPTLNKVAYFPITGHLIGIGRIGYGLAKITQAALTALQTLCQSQETKSETLIKAKSYLVEGAAQIGRGLAECVFTTLLIGGVVLYRYDTGPIRKLQLQSYQKLAGEVRMHFRTCLDLRKKIDSAHEPGSTIILSVAEEEQHAQALQKIASAKQKLKEIRAIFKQWKQEFPLYNIFIQIIEPAFIAMQREALELEFQLTHYYKTASDEQTAV